jgi:hypothetical protein
MNPQQWRILGDSIAQGNSNDHTLAQFAQPFSFDWLEQMVVPMAPSDACCWPALLGGLVGLERELKRKSAGVRTNLLICMGAAFFTLLSGAGRRHRHQQGTGSFEHCAGHRLPGRWAHSAQPQPRQRAGQRGQHLGCGLHRHGLRRGLYAAASLAPSSSLLRLAAVGFLSSASSIKSLSRHL